MRRTKAKTKGYEVAFQKGKTDPIVEAWVHTTHQTSSSRRAVSQKKKKKKPSVASGDAKTKHRKESH